MKHVDASGAVPTVCVVANQRPYPPFHGANADSWRIIRALQMAGVRVACISWRDPLADDSARNDMEARLDGYLEFPVHPAPAGLVATVARPTFATIREVDRRGFNEALAFVEASRAAALLAVGLYGSGFARRLASATGLPLFYRSHAIETEYHRQYFRLIGDGSLKGRARDLAQLTAMARFEHATVAAAKMVFEISCDDLDARCRSAAHWVVHFPPLAPAPLDADTHPDWRERTYDVGYIGNLFMPNNRIGVMWFIEEVLPLLRMARPDVRVAIAGKVADAAFVDSLTAHTVDVIVDPEDANVFARSVRVGVNPIFSGNGTTVKTIDLLWSGCALVTSPIGVQGYGFLQPDQLPIRVALSADEFARGILRQLEGVSPDCAVVRRHLERYSLEGGGATLRGYMGL